jgi:hypothetical protein
VLAEPPREHRLAERVVELVRAGVEEILALEVDALAGCESAPASVSGVGRPAYVVRSASELGAERLVLLRGAPAASSSSSAGISVSGT